MCHTTSNKGGRYDILDFYRCHNNWVYNFLVLTCTSNPGWIWQMMLSLRN